MNFKDFIDNLMSNKKKFTSLFVALMAGILLLILGGGIFPQNKPPPKSTSEELDVKQLEKRVEGILSQIQGAGSVSVMIMVDDSGEKIVATDTKTAGGNLSTDEKKTVIYDGGKQALILKTVSPNVKGVIVAAQGAKDVDVKENIERAVKAILPVLPHRVEVFVKK